MGRTSIFCWCSAFLLGMVAIGCTPEPERTEEKVKPPATSITVVDIPLDEEFPDAQVSLARNFYFIFDGSGSMEGQCQGDTFSSKIEGAKWAVEEFLKSVPSEVNLGLYVFDRGHTGEVVSLAPGNRQEFLTAIKAIDADGGTPLGRAIKFGTDQLVEQYKRQLGYGEFRLVVVTDGMAEGIPEAAQYGIEHRIPIYTIGLCIKGNHPLHHWSVSYRAANSSEDLRRGLEETVAELPSFDLTAFE